MPKRIAYRAVGYAYPTSTIAGLLGAGADGCWYFESVRPDGLGNQDYAGPFASAGAAEAASLEALPGVPLEPDNSAWIRDQVNRSRRTELTETGEQYVMPGCERRATTAGTQLSLWD